MKNDSERILAAASDLRRAFYSGCSSLDNPNLRVFLKRAADFFERKMVLSPRAAEEFPFLRNRFRRVREEFNEGVVREKYFLEDLLTLSLLLQHLGESS